MIALRSVARKSRALAPRVTSVASLRTHLHFKFEAEEAPESLGDTTKLNMCNAIKNAMGTVLKFFFSKKMIANHLVTYLIWSYFQNLQDHQLGRNESTIIFGEDVKFGGVFRCTVSFELFLENFLFRFLNNFQGWLNG